MSDTPLLLLVTRGVAAQDISWDIKKADDSDYNLLQHQGLVEDDIWQ